jgi:cytoskeletal protein CcmA (bactofilin family)
MNDHGLTACPQKSALRASRTRCILAGLLLAAFALAAPAIEYDHTDDFTVPPGQTIETESWVLAQRATINGTAADDLFLLCMSTGILSGRFENDLWCMSPSITLDGEVIDHARLMAQTVLVDAPIGSTLAAVGSTVRAGGNTQVGGDTVLVGENVIFEGTAQGRLLMVANRASLNGHVHRSTRIIADDIVVLPQTVIEGDLVYTSGRELILDDAVTLKGELRRSDVDAWAGTRQDEAGTSWQQRLVLQMYFCAGALLTALVWVALFPRFHAQTVHRARSSGWRCILTGLVALILIPMLATTIIALVVGIPLGLLILLAYAFCIYIGKTVAATALGFALLRQQPATSYGRTISAAMVGLVIIYLLAAIPQLGFAIWFVTTVIGMGAMVLTLASLRSTKETTPTAQPPPVP